MSIDDVLQIVVAESSVIIRSGLSSLLRRIPNINLRPTEVSNLAALKNYVQLHRPDVIIVDPNIAGWVDIDTFRSECPGAADAKFVAIICTVMDNNVLKDFQESFTIYDSAETIGQKLNQMLFSDEEEESDEQEALSRREKEIITYVVKGMTNKEIADILCLSIHTVITHRRNISRKLQIHSSAGLTIYAIVNKLVELKDIEGKL